MGNASQRSAIRPVAEIAKAAGARLPLPGHGMIALQHFCGYESAILFRLDCKEGKAVVGLFAWPVSYFPVDQLPVARKADGACADAAQGKGDRLKPSARVTHIVHPTVGFM